jgi:GTP cyclohydrolase II
VLIADLRAERQGDFYAEFEAAAVSGFRQHLVDSLEIAASSAMTLDGTGAARLVVFRNAIANEPVALIVGAPDLSRPVLVRLHSDCLTGDVFGSRRCDCGDQLRLAFSRIQSASGIVLYLRQEGRGVGLLNKIRAYELQDAGLDTVEANMTLGFESDERDYSAAGRMLQLLGCQRVLLLTNNPAKLAGLSNSGIEISGRVPLHAPVTANNRRLLETLMARAGHHSIASAAEAPFRNDALEPSDDQETLRRGHHGHSMRDGRSC